MDTIFKDKYTSVELKDFPSINEGCDSFEALAVDSNGRQYVVIFPIVNWDWDYGFLDACDSKIFRIESI